MTGDRSPIGDDDLQTMVDGRLSGARAEAVEAWLADAPEVAERVAAERRHRAALRDLLAPIAAEPIPSRLRIANIVAARRRRRMQSLRVAAAAAIVFALGAGAGALAMRTTDGAATRLATRAPIVAAVAEGAGAAYRTFVVEVAHPVEVDATREAHLVGWLSKRLGRPLATPDLSPFGYRLIGGRLLPTDTAAAAQLMYEDPSGQRLTVWVQAADGGGETAFRFVRGQEASTFVWIDRGFGYAVTAAVDRDRLLPIAEAVHRRLTGEDGGGARSG